MKKNAFLDHQLDKDSREPLYRQLKKYILEDIQNQSVEAGDIVPTELQFCDAYNISRTTARQAFAELVAEGWLYRIKGKGTFVSQLQPRAQISLQSMYSSFVDSMGRVHKTMKMQVISALVKDASDRVRQVLGLAPDEKVIEIRRYQKADDEIMGYLVSYLPYPKCAQTLMTEKFENRSMYDILAERPETEVKRVVRDIFALPASGDTAQRLGVPLGEALLVVENTGYSKYMDTPVIWEYCSYIGHKHVLSTEYELENGKY